MSKKDNKGEIQKELVQGQAKFAIELYQNVRKGFDEGSNITLLPLNVASKLVQLGVGARGETREEIKNLLNLPGPQEEGSEEQDVDKYMIDVGMKIRDLESHLPSLTKSTENILIDSTHPMDEDFKNKTSKLMKGTNIQMVDFQTKADKGLVPSLLKEETKANLNGKSNPKSNLARTVKTKIDRAVTMVATRTPARNLSTIDKAMQKSGPFDLNDPPVLNPMSKIGIISGMSFNGKFNFAFDQCETRRENFYPSPVKTKTVKMMHTTALYRTVNISSLRMRIVELPLEDRKQHMYIFLPHTTEGLPALEKKLYQKQMMLNWNDFIASMEPKMVNLALPRFFDQTDVNLMKVLPKMGVKVLTDQNKADLTGLSPASGLCLSEHLSVAEIKVNEKGAKKPELLKLVESSKDKKVRFQTDHQVVDFICNHPFTYIIVEPDSRAILCIGRVVNPPKIRKIKVRKMRIKIRRVITKRKKLVDPAPSAQDPSQDQAPLTQDPQDQAPSAAQDQDPVPV